MQTVDVEQLDLEAGDWVLDVGCGEGRHMHAAYWKQFVHVVGIDLDRSRLREARDGFFSTDEPTRPESLFAVGQADALELPFPTDKFDVVICSEVLEHLPDYQPALDEIDRVLKRDGQLAVSVPRFGPERICWFLSDAYHQVEGGHVRIFRQEELKSSIENTGFSFVNHHYAHALHSPFWWLKCLFWENRDNSYLIEAYDKLLEWDLLYEPRLLEWLEDMLNPLIGKSSVLYFSRDPK
jgi:SAM-dependent methyltransferase